MHIDTQLKSPEKTCWCVITGAPCSGKSSVIRVLARKGYKVIHENARAYIDSQLDAGFTLAEIKSDILSFERHILFEKVRIEKELPKDQIIFLDRAVPDSVAYFEHEGLAVEEPLAYSHRVRYDRIFLFDRLDFESDAVRTEDHDEAGRIGRLIEKCYRHLGYSIIRVPVMPVDQRASFILNHINRQRSHST